MMKKTVCALLAFVLFAACVPGTAAAYSGEAVVEGEIFGGAAGDKIPVAVSFDPAWLTERDARVYDPELAAFSALFAADGYYREKDLAKGTQNRVLPDGSEENYGFTSFLTAAGFNEAEHYESFRTGNYTVDTNDSVTLTIGHAAVADRYDVYAVAIRGAFSAGEWRSAFDPGCEGGDYEALTGAHPEWTDRVNLKSMDVAANRTMAFIGDYMAQTGDASREKRILVTGHSRGGGIANLIGAAFESAGEVVSYTYTFNTPGVTCAKDTARYETVFNVFDSADLFTDILPFGEGSPVRYGRDLSVAVADSEEIRSALAALKGRDDYACVSAETAERYRTLFGERFPGREALYKPETVTRTFATSEEAEAGREACLALIGAEAGLGIEGLCSAGEIVREADGSYTYTFTYCGAALLQAYSMILAYGEAAYTPVITLFAEDETACAIAAILHENADAFSAGHILVNSYVIAGMLA